ncbi:hypothetical protein Tco_1086271, partial [Tanacetum coccineum]
TDNAIITRKRSKPDKHGHGKRKRIQEPRECYQGPTWQKKTSHEPPIGQSPKGLTRKIWKEAHEDMEFCTKMSAKEAQCTKQKRPKNLAWFKEKMLLIEALESRAYLDPEKLAFLDDNEDTSFPAQASQEILTPTAFQTDDLDAFDYDYDNVPSAKAVVMANLSSYDSDVLSEVPFHDTNIENNMSYQSVQETEYSEQPSFA